MQSNSLWKCRIIGNVAALICETPKKEERTDEVTSSHKHAAKSQKLAGVDAAELLQAASTTASQIAMQVINEQSTRTDLVLFRLYIALSQAAQNKDEARSLAGQA